MSLEHLLNIANIYYEFQICPFNFKLSEASNTVNNHRIYHTLANTPYSLAFL